MSNLDLCKWLVSKNRRHSPTHRYYQQKLKAERDALSIGEDCD